MVKYVKNIQFWLVVSAVVWIGLIIATANSRPVIAQSQISELKPPFQFVEESPADRPLVSVRPPGSSIIMTETFGAGFNPVTVLTGTVPLWRKAINPTDTAGYYWGRVGSGAFVNSAWSAVQQARPGLPLLTPGVSTYPAGQDTWLLYGPIDLSKYLYATLSFEYYLNAATAERLLWGVTMDGTEVIGYSSLGGGSGSQWITGTYQFDKALWGNNAVYLAFAFKSGANPNGLGPFIRNVTLRGEPVKFVYAPLILRDYPATPTPTATVTPTPTLPPLSGFTFDEADPRGAGSDLSKWGGKFDGSRSGSFGPYAYGQDVRIGHGKPGNSLSLYTTASFVVNATSPNTLSPTNFDLYVDVSPWRIYPDSRYGLVFGASDNSFGTDPSQFTDAGSYYLLYAATGPSSVAPRGIRLDRCSNRSCTRLSGSTANDGYIALPGSFVGNASAFDTIHLQRDGSAINVWVNDVFMFTVNDGSYLGPRKWGVFILPFQNDPTYPPINTQTQIDFDNIRIYAR